VTVVDHNRTVVELLVMEQFVEVVVVVAALLWFAGYNRTVVEILVVELFVEEVVVAAALWLFAGNNHTVGLLV